jgi:hypothetical protein
LYRYHASKQEVHQFDVIHEMSLTDLMKDCFIDRPLICRRLARLQSGMFIWFNSMIQYYWSRRQNKELKNNIYKTIF